MKDELSLLKSLATTIATTPLERQAATLRAWEACLGLMNARLALPQTARWYLAHPSTAAHVPPLSPAAAQELAALVPRFAVLYHEHRYGSLCGNTGASWTYCALALLPEPPSAEFQAAWLERMFNEIATTASDADLHYYTERFCWKAYRQPPPDALLRVHFAYENPNVREGHSMLHLEVDNDEIINYWPGIEVRSERDEEDFRLYWDETLAEACARLELRHVTPLELACFLITLCCAQADTSGSWGGERGQFHEENLHFMLSERTVKRADDEPQIEEPRL